MTVFISDCHLGSKHCKADKLLKFLYANDDHHTIYLIGDIIDNHQMNRWPGIHVTALEKILQFNEIIYIPGNHDYWFKKLIGSFGKVTVVPTTFYQTIKSKYYMIQHGDKHDPWVRYTHFLSESILAKLFRPIFTYFHNWAFDEDSAYEKRLVNDAKKFKCDGVICGHSHNPANKKIAGIEYINCGDWVENCTGVIEKDGIFTLIP